MSDIYNRISELEQEISLLPLGYISEKTIYGKLRYYRQWTENGKLKSEYIPEKDYEDVKHPDGGTPEAPVGTVFIGVAGPDGTHVSEFHFRGDRDWVRTLAVSNGLNLLRLRMTR